jgi:hypothetical protein
LRIWDPRASIDLGCKKEGAVESNNNNYISVFISFFNIDGAKQSMAQTVFFFFFFFFQYKEKKLATFKHLTLPRAIAPTCSL